MNPINLFEIEVLARERLKASTADYFGGGSDDEVTLRANRTAFVGLFVLLFLDRIALALVPLQIGRAHV